MSSTDCEVLEEQNGSHRYRIQHHGPSYAVGPQQIPPGHLFVMGDNRNNSNDSRVWGTVPAGYVKWRARFIWWSRLGSQLRGHRVGKRID